MNPEKHNMQADARATKRSMMSEFQIAIYKFTRLSEFQIAIYKLTRLSEFQIAIYKFTRLLFSLRHSCHSFRESGFFAKFY